MNWACSLLRLVFEEVSSSSNTSNIPGDEREGNEHKIGRGRMTENTPNQCKSQLQHVLTAL